LVHVAPHRAQQILLRLETELLEFAAIIMVGIADPAQACQSLDQRRVHDVSSPTEPRCWRPAGIRARRRGWSFRASRARCRIDGSTARRPAPPAGKNSAA